MEKYLDKVAKKLKVKLRAKLNARLKEVSTCRPEVSPPLVDSPTANPEPALNLAPASVNYSASRRKLIKVKSICKTFFIPKMFPLV